MSEIVGLGEITLDISSNIAHFCSRVISHSAQAVKLRHVIYGRHFCQPNKVPFMPNPATLFFRYRTELDSRHSRRLTPAHGISVTLCSDVFPSVPTYYQNIASKFGPNCLDTQHRKKLTQYISIKFSSEWSLSQSQRVLSLKYRCGASFCAFTE